MKKVFFFSFILGEFDLYSSGFVIVRVGIIVIGRIKLCYFDEKVIYWKYVVNRFFFVLKVGLKCYLLKELIFGYIIDLGF